MVRSSVKVNYKPPVKFQAPREISRLSHEYNWLGQLSILKVNSIQRGKLDTMRVNYHL